MTHAARGLAGALLLTMLAAAPAATEARSSRSGHAAQKKEKAKKPALHMRADVQAGFAPLTVHFTARLTNVSTDDDAFCHAGSFLMIAGLEEPHIVSGEDPACLHPPSEKHVSLTFSHEFTITRSGLYEFLAMVKTKDGTSLVSNGVPVRVLSSPGGR
ncbi:MAG: hypothetical protein ACE5IK_13720 [Acidobacteriota bacterium]